MIVGASVRSAAQSARRAGFLVTGVDLFGDTDTLDACARYLPIAAAGDVEAIVRVCRDTAWLQVGGLHDQGGLLARLRRDCSRTALGAAEERLRDMGELRRWAGDCGMGFPTTLDGHGRTLPGFADPDNGSQRWLYKQRSSSGGLGVRWLCGGNDRPGGQAFIQAWQPGRAHGATFLSDGNRARLLGVCRSLFTRRPGRPFVYAGSLGPLEPSRPLSASLERLGGTVVGATGLRGLFNADYLLDRAGAAWLLEINPRWSGSSELIERGLIDRGQIGPRDSLFAHLLGAIRGTGSAEALGCNRGPGPVYLKRIVFARRPLQFRPRPIIASLSAGDSLHDTPRDGTLISPGDPVCTVIRKIAPGPDHPLRGQRDLYRTLSGASDDHSPRSSAYE